MAQPYGVMLETAISEEPSAKLSHDVTRDDDRVHIASRVWTGSPRPSLQRGPSVSPRPVCARLRFNVCDSHQLMRMPTAPRASRVSRTRRWSEGILTSCGRGS